MLVACVLSACAGDAQRSVCEGLQVRARVVDPLADARSARDQVSCEAYAAERERLLKQPQ